MQQGSGVWVQEEVGGIACNGVGIIPKGIRTIAENKYGDLILLCFVITCFGALLILSSLG
jgi:hypothetical protein